MDIGLKFDCNSVNADEGYLLTEKQYKAIELLVEGELSKTKIAEQLGITRTTLHRRINDDRFATELQECSCEKKRQAQNFINSKALIAAKRYWALSECGDNRTKCAVLKDWLDRSTGKPNSKVSVEDLRQEQKEDFDIQAALAEIEKELQDTK